MARGASPARRRGRRRSGSGVRARPLNPARCAQGGIGAMLWAVFITTFLILWVAAYAAMPALRFLGRHFARLIARSTRIQGFVTKRKDYWPVVLIVIAGGLLTAWAGDAFLDLAERVHASTPRLLQIDNGVHDWAVSHRSAADTLFFVVMTNAGGPFGVAGVVTLAAPLFALPRH